MAPCINTVYTHSMSHTKACTSCVHIVLHVRIWGKYREPECTMAYTQHTWLWQNTERT